MTPQKVFMDHIHFWILPLILVVIKLLFDLLPKPIFFGSIILIVVGYYSYGRFKTNQSERTAKQLEDSADTFLNELNSADKAKKEKESKKKNLKEQQKQDRLRTQLQKKKAQDGAKTESKTESATTTTTDREDEDADDMLMRMASQQKSRN